MKEDVFKFLSGKGRWVTAAPLIGATLWVIGSDLPVLAKVLAGGLCVGACIMLFRGR